MAYASSVIYKGFFVQETIFDRAIVIWIAVVTKAFYHYRSLSLTPLILLWLLILYCFPQVLQFRSVVKTFLSHLPQNFIPANISAWVLFVFWKVKTDFLSKILHIYHV